MNRGAPKSDPSLRQLLSGGDRRSIARSNRALARVRDEPDLVSELARLTADGDWLVSMRALDLLEKLAHERPEWVAPHKALFLSPLADRDEWEIRLQIVRALPLFSWTAAERRRVLEILRRDADHPQKFVRAWALDGFATFACRDRGLLPALRRALARAESTGSRALQTRARKIRERLSSTAAGASRAMRRSRSRVQAPGEPRPTSARGSPRPARRPPAA